MTGSKEAWVKDPFSLQSFSVLSETVPVTLQEEGQGSGRQGISRSLGIEEIDRLLEEHRLVVVVGGAGAGKTILTKQMATRRVQAQLAGGGSSFGEQERLPLRVALELPRAPDGGAATCTPALARGGDGVPAPGARTNATSGLDRGAEGLGHQLQR